ncbi:MAG TPA: hypothetical protein VHV77_10705, partial [Pirellulales bacterium]|nr:hypothetical protein [Pirellulales bacterium]
MVVAIAATWAVAGARVEMVLATDQQFPATAQRDWYELLTGLKVDNLQIRPGVVGEKIEIVHRGTETAPSYKVVGRLTASNELFVPGAKFSLRDRAALGRWLDTLRNEGSARAQGAARLPFGFSPQRFAEVKADLSRPVDIETQDKPMRATLETLATKLAYPLLADAAMRAKLEASEPIADEFKGMAIGSAIAGILKSAGLVLTPRLSAA